MLAALPICQSIILAWFDQQMSPLLLPIKPSSSVLCTPTMRPGPFSPSLKFPRLPAAQAFYSSRCSFQTVEKSRPSRDRFGRRSLTIAGHKLYAPKGIGALYVRQGISLNLSSMVVVKNKDAGFGTENVAFIVALGAAAVLAQEQLASSYERISQLRNLLHHRLEQLLPGLISLNGYQTPRLPNTLNISIEGTIGEEITGNSSQSCQLYRLTCSEGKY